MAKLRNFTLDGNVMRVIAYTDQHGKQRFGLEILQEFQDKAMTPEQFRLALIGLNGDVCEWDGMLHTTGLGEVTNSLLRRFMEEEEEEEAHD